MKKILLGACLLATTGLSLAETYTFKIPAAGVAAAALAPTGPQTINEGFEGSPVLPLVMSGMTPSYSASYARSGSRGMFINGSTGQKIGYVLKIPAGATNVVFSHYERVVVQGSHAWQLYRSSVDDPTSMAQLTLYQSLGGATSGVQAYVGRTWTLSAYQNFQAGRTYVFMYEFGTNPDFPSKGFYVDDLTLTYTLP